LCVAVIGDFGGDTPAEAQVAALVSGFQPDLVVTVGDNNYPDGAAETIDRHIGKYYAHWIAPYRGAFGPGATENRFFPTLGNHDWRTEGARPYLDYFELPGNERYYELARGDVHLFFVDSDRHEPDGITRDSVQARWLRDALARAPEPHRWVFFHHPPYSSGPHGPMPELQWPFRAWGATAVFSGHDHDYERLAVGDMPYVVVGTGGMALYRFREPIAGSLVRVGQRHGALRLEVREGAARGEFVEVNDPGGDRFALPDAATLPAPVTLVAPTATWHVRDGLAPQDGWLRPVFDQSEWAMAGTPFRIVDRGAPAGAPARTIYYRVEFEATSLPPLRTLELGVPRDNRAVAYLNGREVARWVRMSEKREGWWLVPRGPRSEATSEPILAHQLLDPALLVPGTNVLALEVQRIPGDGADPSFAAELVAHPRAAP
jgi:tartrate-resistant acid phosphatase type 5